MYPMTLDNTLNKEIDNKINHSNKTCFKILCSSIIFPIAWVTSFKILCYIVIFPIAWNLDYTPQIYYILTFGGPCDFLVRFLLWDNKLLEMSMLNLRGLEKRQLWVEFPSQILEDSMKFRSCQVLQNSPVEAGKVWTMDLIPNRKLSTYCFKSNQDAPRVLKARTICENC